MFRLYTVFSIIYLHRQIWPRTLKYQQTKLNFFDYLCFELSHMHPGDVDNTILNFRRMIGIVNAVYLNRSG